MNSTVKNIITFGASGRIDKAQEEYDSIYRSYKYRLALYNTRRNVFTRCAKKYLPLQIKAQKLARKVNKFLPSNEKQRESVATDIGISPMVLSAVDTSLNTGEMVLNSLKGIAGGALAGAAAPAAIMGLVTTFGTAGTGVAIAELSGVAATNAALAALGGGTLMAGGGGVAAGSALLSASVPVVGIAIAAVALPVFSHLSANKKIKAIEEEKLKIAQQVDVIEKEKLKVDYCIRRVEELIQSLKKAERAYSFLYFKTSILVYPLGFISRLIKGRGKRFSERDKMRVYTLLNAAKAMLLIRDTNFMTEIEESENGKEC